MKRIALGKIARVSLIPNSSTVQVESAKGLFYVRLGDCMAKFDRGHFFTNELHPSSELAFRNYIDGMFVFVDGQYKDVRYTERKATV